MHRYKNGRVSHRDTTTPTPASPQYLRHYQEAWVQNIFVTVGRSTTSYAQTCDHLSLLCRKSSTLTLMTCSKQWSQVRVLGFVYATYWYHCPPRSRIAWCVIFHKTVACRSASKEFKPFTRLHEELAFVNDHMHFRRPRVAPLLINQAAFMTGFVDTHDLLSARAGRTASDAEAVTRTKVLTAYMATPSYSRKRKRGYIDTPQQLLLSKSPPICHTPSKCRLGEVRCVALLRLVLFYYCSHQVSCLTGSWRQLHIKMTGSFNYSTSEDMLELNGATNNIDSLPNVKTANDCTNFR